MSDGAKTGRKLGLCHKTAEELTITGELGKGLEKRQHSGGGTGKGKRLRYQEQ